MKKITVFETSVLGFFVGIVISSYISFLSSTDSFIGFILNWISLRPALSYIAIPEQYTLIGSFIFFVVVYTIYGAIIGLFTQKSNNAHKVIVPLIIITLFGAGYEQISQSTTSIENFENNTASVIQALPRSPKQYFGTEAFGDLNGDGLDDVAFLIHRNGDNEDEVAYYLSSALTTSNGKYGTNLVYLGTGVRPQAISIQNKQILITYVKDDEIPKSLYAEILDDSLIIKDTDSPSI